MSGPVMSDSEAVDWEASEVLLDLVIGSHNCALHNFWHSAIHVVTI